MFVINTRSDFIKIPELNPCKIFCSEIRVCKRSIEFAAERKFPVQLRFPLLILYIALVTFTKVFATSATNGSGGCGGTLDRKSVV